MWIHESAERVDLLATDELDCSNLDDVIGFGVNTCSFQVERYECVLVNTGQLFVIGLVWVAAVFRAQRHGSDSIGIPSLRTGLLA